RPVVLAGSTLVVVALPTIALGASAGQPPVTAFGLALFGGGMGGGEVAMNGEGADVEKLGGGSFLPALHGCFSLVTVIGAGLGILANAAGFPVAPHLVLTAAVGAGLLIWAMGAIPAGTGKVTAAERTAQAATPRPALWKDVRLVCIGGVVLAMALAEGTANDWLPLIMVDGHGFGATMGSLVFALFAASMTVGRFAGGPIGERAGRSRVLLVSAPFAATGLARLHSVGSQGGARAALRLRGLRREPRRAGRPRLGDGLPRLPRRPDRARVPRRGDRAARGAGGPARGRVPRGGAQPRHRDASADGPGAAGGGGRAMRIRAVAVVLRKGNLLVMHRRRGGRAYAVLPGGGSGEGESVQDAVLRELREETGLRGRLGALLPVPIESESPALYLSVEVDGTALELGGPERERADPQNVYRPAWVPLAEVGALDLVPEAAREA